MTAIATGRTLKGSFITVDAMVQQSLTVTNYQDCLLKDKITTFNLNEQYLVLAGEEIISFGSIFLKDWCEMQAIKIDLFKKENFIELLKCADRCRRYYVEVLQVPPPEQEKSDVYIASREMVKYYEVIHDGKIYLIRNEREIEIGKGEVVYRGEIKTTVIPPDEANLVQYGLEEITNEHDWRKKEGILIGKLPFDYEFENRFSSVFLPLETSFPVDRKYPFKQLTEQFLKHSNIWEYVADPSFAYSPQIL